VLVADDAAVNRAVAASLVRRLGLAVVEANDGLEALERVGAAPLTAALLDHEMPGLDGLECVRRLRADPRNDTLPLVLVTASDEPALAAAAREAGADAVLVKPVSLRDLEAVLGV
jgi:CheY-like chemotaxis protein